MTIFHRLMLLGLFAGVCSGSFAQSLTKALIKSNEVPGTGGRDTIIWVAGADSRNVLYKITGQEVDNRNLSMSSVKALYYFTPPEYITALTSFQNAHYKESKAQFAEVQNKYKSVMASPGNYALKALHMELESAVMMLDFKEVKRLAEQFEKHKRLFSRSMETDLEVYDLLGKLSEQKYDEVVNGAKTMLLNKKKWSLKQLARISYAQGMALAEKIQGSKDNRAADHALDSLAMVIAAYHGGGTDLASSAMVKSMEILAVDPTVKAFIAEAPKEIDADIRKASPVKLQELAGLVYAYKNILFPDRKLEATYDQYLRFHQAGSEKYVKPKQAEQPKAAGDKKAGDKKQDNKKGTDKKPDNKKPNNKK